MPDFTQSRDHMVISQINPNGVTDKRILEAFRAIPREAFVPASRAACCYVDDPVEVGAGRLLTRPADVARMISALGPRANDRALCLGGATGYAAAIMARLCTQVTDLEADDALTPLARQGWEECGATNIHRQTGDLQTGPAGGEAFDVILAEGAYAEFPAGLAECLTPGGRMVCLIVPAGRPIGTTYLTTRPANGGPIATRPLFDAWAPYAPGCAPAARFAFAG